jgi:transcriptional regulator with XRE-family HTH domain
MANWLQKREAGKLIYKLMLARGMTQTELAAASGMTREMVSNIIRGRSYPSRIDLEKIENALDAEPGELLSLIPED